MNIKLLLTTFNHRTLPNPRNDISFIVPAITIIRTNISHRYLLKMLNTTLSCNLTEQLDMVPLKSRPPPAKHTLMYSFLKGCPTPVCLSPGEVDIGFNLSTEKIQGFLPFFIALGSNSVLALCSLFIVPPGNVPNVLISILIFMYL